MRVEDNSHLQIQSSRHHNVDGHNKKDGLEHVKGRHDHGHNHEGRALGHHKRTDPVDISDEARAHFESMKKRSSEAREKEFSVPGGLDPKGLLNRLVLGAFSGKDINVTGLLGPDQAQGLSQQDAPVDSAQAAQGAESAGAAGFSAEVEQLSFQASGTIKTRDGEEVGFTLELNLTRASMSGFAADAAIDGQNGISVNFGGTSSELFSMSFEFNIASDDEGAEPGVGSLKVEKPETDSVAEDDEDASDGQGPSLSAGATDFMKLLRRADFTSTYLSFSRTTIDASSFMLDASVDPALAARPVIDPQPLNVLA